jgi:hypothetical protein
MKVTLKELKEAGYSRDDYKTLLLACAESGRSAFTQGKPASIDGNRQFIAGLKGKKIPDAAWAECYKAYRQGWSAAHVAKTSRELELDYGLGF